MNVRFSHASSIATVSAILLATACSSSDSTEDSCSIPGTYTFTSVSQTQSAGCAATAAQADASTTPATVTINADQTGFQMQFSATTGTCAATLVSTCKIQAKCDYTLGDALNPADSDVTLQFSWTFTATGFTGLTAGHSPAGKSNPEVCDFTSSATGTKQ